VIKVCYGELSFKIFRETSRVLLFKAVGVENFEREIKTVVLPRESAKRGVSIKIDKESFLVDDLPVFKSMQR